MQEEILDENFGAQSSAKLLPIEGRKKFVFIAMSINLILHALVLLSSFWLFDILKEIGAGDYSRLSEVESSAALVVGLSGIYILAFICSAVAIPVWLYRANQNIQLGGAKTDYTSGWAAGWFFIPIANFFMPIKVMAEIWKGTQFISGLAGTNWKTIGSSSIILLWWLFYLISGFLSNIANRFVNDEYDLSKNDYDTAMTLNIIAFILILISALSLFKLLIEITKKQEEVRKNQ